MNEAEFTLIVAMAATMGGALFFIFLLAVTYQVIVTCVRPLIREIGIAIIPFNYQYLFGIRQWDYHRKTLTCGIPHRELTCSFRKCKYTGELQIWSINQSRWSTYTQLSINYLNQTLIYKFKDETNWLHKRRR